VPEIEFRFDETIEHQDRIEQILQDLKNEDERRALETPKTVTDPDSTDFSDDPDDLDDVD
jgi:hypothetical protein